MKTALLIPKNSREESQDAMQALFGKSKGKKHPGFKAVQSKIAAKEGISKDRAGAILASASRNASPAAKKSNPALKHVKS